MCNMGSRRGTGGHRIRDGISIPENLVDVRAAALAYL